MSGWQIAQMANVDKCAGNGGDCGEKMDGTRLTAQE